MEIQTNRRRLLLLGIPFLVLFLVAVASRISGQVQAADPMQVQGRYNHSRTLLVIARIRAEAKRGNGMVRVSQADLNLIELQLNDYCGQPYLSLP
jgi:hypothetical protein